MKIEHNFPFDPTYGFTEGQLLRIKTDDPRPDDFADFWRNLYRKAVSFPPSYHVEDELWSPNPRSKIYRVRFRTFDGFSIGMWVVRPEHSSGGLLVGQGYCHMVTPPAGECEDMTVALPNIRGLGLSQCGKIPWEISKHCIYGIDDKEKFVITGAVIDLWTALSVAADMFPDTKENWNYSGGSLGGGLGAIGMPWDARVKSAELNIPTLAGPYQFQFQLLASPDDPAAIRARCAFADPKAMESIYYCNAVTAASYFNIPVLMTPARFDPSNPPPAQFAIANAIPKDKLILRIRDTGHFTPTDNDKNILEPELEKIRKTLRSGERDSLFNQDSGYPMLFPVPE